MKKFISSLILIIFFILVLVTIVLSTIGIETNKFNNLFSKKISKKNNNIDLKLNTIKFKFDIKKASLFLETNSPLIIYRNIPIPAKEFKIYLDFISLIKINPKIKKINLILHELNIEELKKISVSLKPSNLISFLNNNINQGQISTELEIYLNNNSLFDNFIARGSVSNLSAKIINNINIEKVNFDFFSDKSDILLKNLNGETGPIKIEDGDLKAKLSPEIYFNSNFKSKINYNKNIKFYENFINDINFFKNLTNIEAQLNNSFSLKFDKTYKVKEYDYKINGKIKKAKFNFNKPIENSFLNEKINQLSLVNSEIKTYFNLKKNSTNISGKYSLNKDVLLPFNLDSKSDQDKLNFKIKIDYKKKLDLEFLNYSKPNDLIANIYIDINKDKDGYKIKELNYLEGNSEILAEDIELNKDKLMSLKKISIRTEKNGKKNNEFLVLFDKKILIKGKHYDSSNLPKILSQNKKNNIFSNINKDIEIDFTNIIAPLSESIKNFRLIGKIEKGGFSRISSKGDFGENNFLEITLKKDHTNKKKYLEIYSDLTKPLLTEYSFFKGLSGGKLLYSSVIDGDNSISKLNIENFKVVNAPGMIKLLSLADLSGLADLAEGEGITFDVLEINMKKNDKLIELDEVIALGPSISVLMDGYHGPNVTSLRGTLIPAKTLNKMLSKIPLLGNIIIPKEIGEGLFGISFKMKGPPGKIKTTINPIRTITPRFIQKIIDRNKVIK